MKNMPFACTDSTFHDSWQDEEWNQEEFERLLAEWVVVCDQPFDEVDEPAFRCLLEYSRGQPKPTCLPVPEGIFLAPN
jgi:hypothetical protein